MMIFYCFEHWLNMEQKFHVVFRCVDWCHFCNLPDAYLKMVLEEMMVVAVGGNKEVYSFWDQKEIRSIDMSACNVVMSTQNSLPDINDRNGNHTKVAWLTSLFSKQHSLV